MKRQTRHLNLGSASGFIDFFGNEENKKFLINFLNQVLPDKKIVHDLNYEEIRPRCRQEEVMGASIGLTCDVDGDDYLVDLQLPDSDCFPDWSMHSLSTLICNYALKLRTADPGIWADFGIRNTSMVAVLPFKDQSAPDDSYISHAQFRERKTGVLCMELITFTLIQLPNFKKTGQELITDLDRWLYLFQKRKQLETIPAPLKQGIFPEVLEAAGIPA